MAADLSVTFTGIRFENPFLLASAPPTESESNILNAFEAGWGGVVTKTIGMHPVANVAGPKTKFLRADADSAQLSMKKRPGAALHSSWNWELISDKALDWWVPRLEAIKKGKLDALLYDRPILAWNVRKNFMDEIDVLEMVFAPENYAIAVRQGSPLRAQIDLAMLDELGGGWWRDVLQRYFGHS